MTTAAATATETSARDSERQALLHRAKSSALWIDNVTVSFDGFKALRELNLLLEPGELRCIIGPNGAGKTTMMDVVTGKTRPDEGHVYMSGMAHELTALSEVEIVRRGIGRKFQRPTVFESLSVFENLELACRGRKGALRSLFASVSPRQAEAIEKALVTIGLQEQEHLRSGLLSHGQKQWLEIGMLLVQDPKVMLVDEPVAGMTHQEIERTAELLVSLAGDRTVVVVEHDMDFVRRIARTVTVLHEGYVLAEGPMDQVQSDPRVIEVYLGGSSQSD